MASPRRRRLSRSGEFDRVYRDGTSQATRYLVLYSFPRRGEGEDGAVRLGVSVGRKVGGAVERNRVKRWIRECFRRTRASFPVSLDLVVVARPGAADARHESICRELKTLAARFGAAR